MKKSCLALLVAVILLGTSIVSPALALGNEAIVIENDNMTSHEAFDIHKAMGDTNYSISLRKMNPTSGYQPQGAGPVLIFFAGILSGYIIDGIVHFATGATSGEWVSIALSYFFRHPDVTHIYVSSNGNVYGGRGGSL